MNHKYIEQILQKWTGILDEDYIKDLKDDFKECYNQGVLDEHNRLKFHS